MAGEWPRVRLGDVVEINPDSINSAWPYPYIRYVDISSVGEGMLIEPPQVMSVTEAPSRAKRLVQEGDTVLSTVRPGRRSMFYVKRAEPDLVVSTGFAVLRPRKDRIEPRYLYACVYDKAFTEFLVRREKGAAYPAVLPDDIADAMINLPPLSEQRAIAHILGTLDDKIELNRRMSETLEQMAQAMFKAWFVDFEPVRAKMEGRWRRGESLPGLPAHLYDLFPDRLVDSELGEIPEGWEVTQLDDLANIHGGKQLPTEECKPIGTFPVFGANGIMGYTERTTHKGFVIAFGRVGAYCGSVHWTYSGAWINNNASSVVPIRWPEFILQAMLNADFEGMRTGSAQPFIPNATLAVLPILRPPNAVLDLFCLTVRQLRMKQEALHRQSRTLAALRDALLPKLISGELRVKDAERFLKERGL